MTATMRPLSCQMWSNRLEMSLRRSARLGSACQKRAKSLWPLEGHGCELADVPRDVANAVR